MTEHARRHIGGCLCGALRYEARGEPTMAGHCYCADCRRASGSGFIPFMGFSSDALTFSGETRVFLSRSARGGEAARNACPICFSLVFGGVVGQDTSHTIYAGSLDDPSVFQPTIAIFASGRPAWALVPEGLTIYESMPG